MDFARKQLEKYGWTDGKGLGKHENGISEALKPKLKRSVAGIGHDAAADFTEHWWTTLYNKAAGNVQVEEKNGKTKKIKTKDDKFKITNSTWKLNKKPKDSDEQDEYSEYFVRKAVLLSDGSKTENVNDDSDSEEEVKETKDITKMTDEELFAACGGRTAHKGARHGLKATGKLARIERQEKLLLSHSQYNGYSHSKKNQNNLTVNDLVIEDVCLNSDTDHSEMRKKKKKHKHCLNREHNPADVVDNLKNYYETSVNDTNLTQNDNNEIHNEDIMYKKLKKSKRKAVEVINGDSARTEDNSAGSVKKSGATLNNDFENDRNNDVLNKKLKKSKRQTIEVINEDYLRIEENLTENVKNCCASPNDINYKNDDNDEIVNEKLKKTKRNDEIASEEDISTFQCKKNKKKRNKNSEVSEEIRMFSSDNNNIDEICEPKKKKHKKRN